MSTTALLEDVRRAFAETSRNFTLLETDIAPAVVEVGEAMVAAFRAGGKLLLCGNGGSAADAQHIAAELTGRYLRERRPLPAIALTTDTSAITAIANDYDFDSIFARQVHALGNGQDVILGISTSGRSRNVLNAMKAAGEIGMMCVGLLGQAGGPIAEHCDHVLCVPSTVTPRIQEMHIAVGHALCDILERAFSES